MAETFNSLDKTFNTTPIQPKESKPIVPSVEHSAKIEDRIKDIESDYKYTRKNLYSIIQMGQDALESALEAAQETNHARSFEVVSQLIKSVSDASDKLIELQRNMNLIENDKSYRGPTTVNNSVFLGSTAELAKFVKLNMNKEISEIEDNK